MVDAGQGNGLVKINLKFLGVGNGLTDPVSQYPEYVNYALNNPYLQTTTQATITRANNSLYSTNGCMTQV